MADDSKTANPGTPADATPTAGDPRSDARGSDARGSDARASAPLMPTDPVPDDQLDPELIALLRPARRRVGPITALCVVIFCGYIMGKLYDDLRFSRQSVSPRSYGSVAEMLANGSDGEYVRVHAVPDRSFAMKVAHGTGDGGFRLAPAQGSDGRLWLMIGGEAWAADIRYEEASEGRLRAVEDLPFVGSLQDYVRARGPEPRYVRAQAVQDALASKAAVVRAPGGDRITMTGDTPVRFSAQAQNLARVYAVLTDRLTDADAVTQALVDAGLAPAGIQPQPGPTQDSLVYLLPVPGSAPAASAVNDKLRQHGLFSIRAEPIDVAHATTWSQLAPGGEALLIDGKPVPWSTFEWVLVEVPRELPAGARVLLTQDSPEDYWYVLPLFVLLGLSGVLFLWAFGRSLWLMRGASRGASDAVSTPA